MVIRPGDFPAGERRRAERLSPSDGGALAGLFFGQADAPDSFDRLQLESGVFYGVREAGKLVSAAGTHVIGREAEVAAVGNVFTHPDFRRRGFAARASAAVVADLFDQGIQTIVLNAAMDNEPALKMYRALGFWPFCGYYEGVGEIAAR
jgi:predicted GNAT family acetyltransferase